MLGLNQNQAIQAIEEILIKLKSGEAKLHDFSFTTDGTGVDQLSIFNNGGPQAALRQRPRFKIELDIEIGFVPLQTEAAADWGEDVPDEEFTIDQDGLPATDEYAWSTSADVQARTMKVVNGTAKPRPSFAGDITRQLLGPRRREFPAPVKAPKAKKQFGSRDLDID